jgi:hypothetical protein
LQLTLFVNIRAHRRLLIAQARRQERR